MFRKHPFLKLSQIAKYLLGGFAQIGPLCINHFHHQRSTDFYCASLALDSGIHVIDLTNWYSKHVYYIPLCVTVKIPFVSFRCCQHDSLGRSDSRSFGTVSVTGIGEGGSRGGPLDTVWSRRSRGLTQPPFAPIYRTTWAGFLASVHQKLPDSARPAALDEVAHAGLQPGCNELQRYLTQAFEKARRCPNHISEPDLQRACLDALVAFGDRVLEDASDGVNDYRRTVTSPRGHRVNYAPDTAAGQFRAVTFVSLGDNSPRADYALLRRSCEGGDVGPAFQVVAPYPTATAEEDTIWRKARRRIFRRNGNPGPARAAPVPAAPAPDGSPVMAPTWRMMPWEVIAFLELKKKEEKLNAEHMERLAYCCENLLRITPGRQAAFGVLTNLRECRFVAACAIRGKLMWYAGDTITDPALAIRELAHFLTTPMELLHATFRFPIHLLRPERPIGRGSTGVVMVVTTTGDNTKLVAKISANPFALETERIILSHLHDKSSEPLRIPRIAAEQQRELGSEVHPPGSALEYCNLFEREFQKARRRHFTAEQLCGLWDTLSKVHALGVVHCDLRTPNMAFDERDTALTLLDWASSRPYDTEKYPLAIIPDVAPPILRDELLQKTSMITASPAVLASMERDERRFECFPADEAVSMIYLTLQVLIPGRKEIHLAPASIDIATDIQDSIMTALAEHNFGGDPNNQIAMYIQKFQDERLTIAPEELRQDVHTAIYLLFDRLQGDATHQSGLARQLFQAEGEEKH